MSVWAGREPEGVTVGRYLERQLSRMAEDLREAGYDGHLELTHSRGSNGSHTVAVRVSPEEGE